MFLFCVFIFSLSFFSFYFYCVPCVRFHNKYNINLPLRGDSFAIFLRYSQRLYASMGSFQVFSLVAFGGQTTKILAFSRGGGIFPQIFNRP